MFSRANVNKNRCWSSDIKKKGFEKFKKVFDKIPYNFNVVLKSQKYFSIDPFDKVYDKKYGHISTSDHITFIITNNSASEKNYVPLTPWIVLHRLGHAMSFKKRPARFSNFDYIPVLFGNDIHHQLYKENGKIKVIYDSVALPVWNGDIIHQFRKYDIPSYNKLRYFRMTHDARNDFSLVKDLVPSLFTMKSARDNKITNMNEFGPECLAQYTISGKVTLNRVENWKEKVLNHPYLELLNDRIERWEKLINKSCKMALDNAVGKVFKF